MPVPQSFWLPTQWVDILDLIKVGILVLKAEGEIIFANREAHNLLGENLVEQNFLAFLEKQDREIFWPNVRYLVFTKGFYEGEVLLVPAKNKSFVAHLYFSLYETPEMAPLLVLTFQNISQVKALERSLRESRHPAFLGRLLSDISHHIRNPILVIGGLAKRLSAHPERASAYAGTLLYQCERLIKLLEALERFILLPTPSFRQTEISEVLESLKGRFSPATPSVSFPEEGVTFTFLTDPKLLVEALAEVIKNAREAHAAAGKEEPVSFDFEREGENIVFLVKDQGEGIRDEVLPFIFNPFFTTKPGHFGMGLTLASRIVEELAGHIEVANPRHPTVFRLSFPLDRRRPERRRLLFKA